MTAFLFAGVRRLSLVITGLHATFMTTWECAIVSHTIIWSFEGPLSGLTLLAISIDRLLAVSVPLRYLAWSRNYVFVLFGIVYGWSFITGPVAYIGLIYTTRETAEKLIGSACFMGSNTLKGVNRFYVSYHTFSAPVFAFVSIVVYGFVWIVYKKKQGKVSAIEHGSNAAQSTQQNRNLAEQRRMTITLGIGCLFTLFVFMIPRIMGYLTTDYLSSSIRMWFFIISNFNPLFNIFIYSMRHQEMKQGLIGLFTCKQMPNNIDVWQGISKAKKNRARVVKPVNDEEG